MVRGVFVILPTPFDEALALDVDGLRSLIRFSLACGARGLVTPAIFSEQPFLTDEERRVVVRIAVEEAAGRVPVVAGVTAPTAALAARLAQEAEAIGATMLIARPPTAERAAVLDYYRAIDAAGSLPIWVQNYGEVGRDAALPAALIAELLATLPDVRFLKEETTCAGSMMTAVATAAGTSLDGMMGGKGGLHLLDEHRRGACGTMPACEFADVHVALWDALERGDGMPARALYGLLLPVLVLEAEYGISVAKEALRRRGVIRCAAMRQPDARQLDAHAMATLSDALADLAPALEPAYPLTG